MPTYEELERSLILENSLVQSVLTKNVEDSYCLAAGEKGKVRLWNLSQVCPLMYFLRFKKVGTLDWARPFPADASSTSRANEGPASSALPWPMAYRPWALAELTRRRPFVDTGHLVVIRRKLRSNQVTVDCGKAFLLF